MKRFLTGLVLGLLLGFGVLTTYDTLTRPSYSPVLSTEPVETYRESSDIKYSNDFSIRYTELDVQCLQANIFHEARNQGELGQLAVATVTVNRFKSRDFPNTICDVITQGKKVDGKPVLNRCAFSWFCDGVGDRPNLNNKITFEAWIYAEKLARAVLSGETPLLSRATHYHTTAVNPYWSNHPSMKKIKIVGDHIFYIETLRT